MKKTELMENYDIGLVGGYVAITFRSQFSIISKGVPAQNVFQQHFQSSISHTSDRYTSVLINTADYTDCITSHISPAL